MNDDALRRAYQAGKRESPLAARPTPDELRRLAAVEGADEERLAILERALADPQARDDLELLRAIVSAQAAEARAARRWRPVPLALAASLLVAAAALLLRPARDQNTVRAPAEAGAPVPLLPAADVTTPSGSVRFVWRPVPDAARYRLEVLSDAGVLAASAETRDTFTVIAPQPPGAPPASYRWVVVALLPDGVEVASRPRRITLTP